MIAPILLKKINPSNHKTRIIMPIINRILILPPFFIGDFFGLDTIKQGTIPAPRLKQKSSDEQQQNCKLNLINLLMFF